MAARGAQFTPVRIVPEEQAAFHDSLRNFVDQHERRLVEVQQSFSAHPDAMVWDVAVDAVSLQLGGHGLDPHHHHELTSALADVLGRTQLQNRLFFRIVVCLSTAVLDMRALAKEGYEVLLPPLVLFGDDNCHTVTSGQHSGGRVLRNTQSDEEEEVQRGFERLLGALEAVWDWHRRVRATVLYVTRQLASLYAPAHASGMYQPYTEVHLPVVWNALCELLGAVVCVEEVVEQHSALRQGLQLTRKRLAQALAHADRIDEAGQGTSTDLTTLKLFGRLLNRIEREVLDGGSLQRLVLQPFDCETCAVGRSEPFRTEFEGMLEHIVAAIEGACETPQEGSVYAKMPGVLALFYLYGFVFHRGPRTTRPSAAKQQALAKRLFALHVPIPAVHIDGPYALCPALWMAKHIPEQLQQIVKDPVREANHAIRDACLRRSAQFLSQLNRLTTLTTTWIAEMQSVLPTGTAHYRDVLQTSTLLIQRGLLLAHDMQTMMVYLITLHHCANLPLARSVVLGVCNGLQLLAMIRATYHARTGVTASSFNVLVQSVAYVTELNLFKAHQQLNAALLRSSSARLTDQHSAVGQAIALLHKPQTTETLVCLAVVLDIAFNRGEPSGSTPTVLIDEKLRDDIFVANVQLGRIATYQQTLRRVTDCTFVYWQRESFLPLFLQQFYHEPRNAACLPYLLTALQDCRATVLAAQHVRSSAALWKEYQQFMRRCLVECLVRPVCTDVENDLRLHTHAVVLGQPFRVLHTHGPPTRDLATLMRLPRLRLFGEWFDIAATVESYLDAQFYHLAALMPNDWATYEEMRRLAQFKYGLRICDGYLPAGLLTQGLDVLVITENTQVFVAHYTYEMNEQLFIQRPGSTESRHLHALHARHVANSIRTHGTGIMNTAVNHVYKCLLKKLAIVSQFLSDAHVKSRLLQDAKFVQGQKSAGEDEYPVERAREMIREIGRLGLADDGDTFIDKLRELVSEMGNALGYVRMMRSGGLRFVAESAACIPSPADSVHSVHDEKRNKTATKGLPGGRESKRAEDEAATVSEDEDDDGSRYSEGSRGPRGPRRCCVTAVRNVDRVIATTAGKLSSGSEYLPMLLRAIAHQLQASVMKSAHLRLFYLAVPPMCVSFVERTVREKEQLEKQCKDGLFTDAGFALGCSFLLALFGVCGAFDSLHWFATVRRYYGERLASIQRSMASAQLRVAGTGQVPESTANLHLSAAMTTMILREYDQLEEAFGASSIFFF